MAEQGKIRVLIVDDIAETRDNLEKLLFFEKDIEVVAKASTGREAVALSKQYQPDVVLMDINMPDMDGIAATEAMISQVPTTQVIMMSVQGEQDYLRRSMLAGAREFLIKPISAEDLYNAIRHVYRLRTTQRVAVAASTTETGGDGGGPDHGQIIAVFSPKGGVGTSSIAANLAVTLRQQTNKKVALVDGNLILGDLGVIMNMVSNKTVADLANRIAELDRDLLYDVLATHTTQVKVMLAPPNPQMGELVTSDHLRAILDMMRKEFDYVVVDTPSSFQDRALAILDMADRIAVLMTLEMTCIKNIKLFLEVAELLEYSQEKILLVLNKADSRLGIRVENVEETIRHKVTHQIANAAHEMTLAINQGLPMVIEKRGHQTAKDIAKLAAILSDDQSGASTKKDKDSPSSEPAQANRGGLFSRLIAKR
ncbi:MAG: DNA-binding response regulator, NarL/FixJ family, contains REC and HTH domains [Chloroflexi bacterium AL-W]|nr:DNA-binding response regulator, NarL/FixJ family, contains REC and HTH domains [Chloroflexi bacterium AL-N1]NOK65734.1 DNA-binding response regulator, NarL/FixJ family, contains REC and HTH domains [Chloroflexi bacterium AL-N10]NOK74325.1 DNA-binding response regulator, NarL/FixJ family, contains REC and HTH domains [Chloroflexi bacterium AL-N5]NOK80767.1 DNA-binding response regulator, NarL/FixJ family, contains REC and HTH domains [Chloroflexi bacterium AL-W]NOK88583.1 DNA-binding response